MHIGQLLASENRFPSLKKLHLTIVIAPQQSGFVQTLKETYRAVFSTWLPALCETSRVSCSLRMDDSYIVTYADRRSYR